jgi:hypothetical protein
MCFFITISWIIHKMGAEATGSWSKPSSGMLRRVDLVWTDFSEEHIASNFMLGVSASLHPPAHAGFSLADFSTLKMKAIRSSETSVHTRSTRRYIPENGTLHSHRRGNLKSNNWVLAALKYVVQADVTCVIAYGAGKKFWTDLPLHYHYIYISKK